MKAIFPLALLLAAAAPASAQDTASSPIVGYNTVTVRPNSDTIIGLPFIKGIDAAGAVTAISQTGSQATLTTAGPLVEGAFADSHYVRFRTGDFQGQFFRVISNTATQLVIDTEGDVLNSGVSPRVIAGNEFDVIPFWTLATLFPPASPNGVVPSAGELGFNRRTVILIPDNTGPGLNRSASASYFLDGTSGSWKAAVGFAVANNTKLWPDSFLIIRHPASVATATSFVPTGTVDSSKFTLPLATSATSGTDNYVAIPRPVDLRLDELNLIAGGGFVGSQGTLGFNRRDQLLVFDNTVSGINKSASASYFYDLSDNTWKNASGFANSNAVIIPAATGFIIRKAVVTGGGTKYWINNPTY